MDGELLLAVSSKGKRKVKVNGRSYIWYIQDAAKPLVPEEGFVGYGLSERLLHIISSNKQFIVHYRIPSAGDPDTILDIEGPDFPRSPGATRVHVPRWRHDTKRYPTADFVRRLIGWCLESPEP